MNTIRHLLARYLNVEIRYTVLRWRAGCWQSHDSYFRDHASAMAICIKRRAEHAKWDPNLKWCVEREVVWATRREPAPRDGDIMLINTFLWLPLTLDGKTRWLERAQYTMVCRHNRALDGYVSAFDWEPLHWVG